MAHKHKKTQGKGYVTHRSRGRFTLLSPQNLRLPSTTELLGPAKPPSVARRSKPRKGKRSA